MERVCLNYIVRFVQNSLKEKNNKYGELEIYVYTFNQGIDLWKYLFYL